MSQELEHAVASWLASHQEEIGATQLRLSNISGSSLLFQSNSKRIHMSVPTSDEEVFLATAADPDPDSSFNEALLILNEKYERLRPEQDALFIAMEYLLTALKKLEPSCSTHSGSGADADDDGDDDHDDGSDDEMGEDHTNDYSRGDEVDYGYDMASVDDASGSSVAFMEIRCKGFLYTMAVEAKQQCEAARHQFHNPCTASDTLAWCIVKPDPSGLMIHIKMQIGGIMHDDVAAASLGLPVNFPLRISLEINRDFWCKAQCTSSLKIDACHVKALSDHNKDPSSEDASQKTSVLFLQIHGKKRRDHWLRALPNWCITCWDTLPYKVGRLRTCEKDLCLYRFEELGLGTAILQEVHKSSELIDFEISIAIAAAASFRDVFEPFPAFLLEKEEMRDRSGWFSKKSKPDIAEKSGKHISHDKQSNNVSSNKSFPVLKSILNSYPSLEEMQCFKDELQLKKALAKLWLKALESQKHEVPEQWRQKAWLPYDVFRFLISSNRLTMSCLKDSEQLDIQGVIYQFAVLHDNPEKEAHFEKRRAEKGGSFFAFHGSPAGNWFSILRNGLRSLSNTRYMSTGAVYGAGIYTSIHMETSFGYAMQNSGWKHGRMYPSFNVLAICEIVNGSLVSNQPAQSIMVVRPECEQDVLIRYILVLSTDLTACCRGGPTRIQQETQLITSGEKQTDLWDHHSRLRESYYTKQQNQWKELRKARWLSLSVMEEEEERRLQFLSHAASVGTKGTHSSRGMPTCMQAIQKELRNILIQINAAKKKKLQKNAEISILALIEINVPDETNLQKWHVELSQDLFKESPLYNDLVRRAKFYNQPCTSVKLECLFPDSFPMAPPFIRIVSPRFKFHTGHVTVGGSICMELLTESGWSPAFCFESVLVQIVSALMEGGARVDLGSSNFEYGIHEAQAAFDRVARDHGWIKG
ncbi:hypothetical protein GOP47_0018124 [Adiantum capillus-veneris]|uniref:UBC core domain-containing protein n=1 Tax=Adiantum capillus-veneris TaxID=13818 RepID=A0A9D4UGQ6_ADICA|nr:hypothetical protein GOP47_0018124 [Adiantum capillus-veneris]